ncbi:hypothetical protein [uncultured Winogradskyella sp.]|uniref:hypothetical protein n=1 Tax=uncultured Winogradskyella sp. TaxID=395353 RepID=UPI0030D8AE9C|tara:strand:+ start:47315 stop:48286 length:972 start_codon:yes stop_codon:yes gene_type:complete
MKLNYSISIPKPCHEDWSKMSKNEKGRFCKSCCKTVVDFTHMNVNEIQNYIHNNKNKRICGHIKQSQLKTINLKIPEVVFNKTWNFRRLFLLALLLTMGTTLFTCSNTDGKKQKINSIEVVETYKKSIDTILKNNDGKKVVLDTSATSLKQKVKPKIKDEIIEDGMVIIETVGEIDVIPTLIDDLNTITIDDLEIETPDNDDDLLGLLVIENPPKFLDTPDNLTLSEKREYFSKRIIEIVMANFNSAVINNLNSEEKEKINTQFKIDEKGFVKDIKIRGSYNLLIEEEIKRVLNLLPQLKPGNHRSKNIATIFTLPISFIIED